jgi:hypothetical protein
MATRGALTNAAWARPRPLPRPNGQRGGQRRDHRQVINALKRWRGIATRHDKRVLNDRAAVGSATIAAWLAR